MHPPARRGFASELLQGEGADESLVVEKKIFKGAQDAVELSVDEATEYVAQDEGSCREVFGFRRLLGRSEKQDSI